MGASFLIDSVDDGFFQFSYLNSKGERVLISQEFETRSMLEQAIQDVRVGSLMSQQIAKGQTPEGDYFFMIKDSGGQIVAKSVLFANEMSFDNALHNVRENACVAELTYVS